MPFNFTDQINISAMVAAWLGALFTGIGLIAVLSQLRIILGKLRSTQERTMTRVAGNWAILFDKNLGEKGLMEGVAPALSGWIQHAYMHHSSICITQDDRGTGGTSGWSKLFAQCRITAEELIAFGGPSAQVFPATTGHVEAQASELTDVIMEEGRILYGFSAGEFAALLIICGFSPVDLAPSGTTCSTKYMGTMYLAAHGPFSQIARFDPHSGCRKISQDLHRYINLIPVATSIDYALGLLRTTKRGQRDCIIFPRELEGYPESEFGYWKALPLTGQLNAIRYNYELLVGISGADLLKYSVETTEDRDFEDRAMAQIGPELSPHCPGRHEALLIGHALTALRPWGPFPVLQQHFVKAFRPVLQPFVGTRAESIGALQQRLLNEPGCKPIAGWTDIHEQAMGLGQVGDIKTQFFSGAATPCRHYFKAMNLVFDRCRVRISDVRVQLAARAAYTVLRRLVGDMGNVIGDEELFVSRMVSHLQGGSSYVMPPPWAVTIYATFLWGWLNDFIETDDNFKGRFRRRIFMS